jgi:hypothetical protein
VWAPVEKLYTDRVLEVTDDFRYCGLRYAKMHGGSRHAPMLAGRQEHMQVAQPDAPANLAFPIDFSSHR